MITLHLSDREAEVIRMALRTEYDKHKRNDFKALALENDELRSKLNDAIIDNKITLV